MEIPSEEQLIEEEPAPQPDSEESEEVQEKLEDEPVEGEEQQVGDVPQEDQPEEQEKIEGEPAEGEDKPEETEPGGEDTGAEPSD